METLYLIDGNSFAYRAFYAIRPLTAKDGTEVHAVYGFYAMVKRIVTEKNPSHLAFAFDHPSPTFRHKMFKDYKIEREEMPDSLKIQMKIIKEIAKNAGIAVLEAPGYEADDILGAVAVNLKQPVVIATGDKDMMQVVDKRVSILRFTKAGEVILTPEKIKEEYGINPGEIVDVLALMGDATDGIPGVKGIGEKTAFKMVQEYGSVDSILKKIDTLKPERFREVLKAEKDILEMSRKLAVLDTGKTVLEAAGFDEAKCAVEKIDKKALDTEFLKYNFKSLVSSGDVVKNEVKEATATVQAKSFDQVMKAMKKSKEICVFFAGEEANEKPEMVLAKAGDTLFYILGSDFDGLPAIDAKISVITNSSKAFFKNSMLPPENRLYDLMLMAYLLNPEKSYKEISHIYTEYEGSLYLSYEDVTGKGAKKIMPELADKKSIDKFASPLLENAATLRRTLQEKLAAEKMEALYFDIEMPIAAILASMEKTGLKIDRKYLAGLSDRTGKEVSRIEKKIRELAGEEINLNSPKQLSELLFDKLGLKSVKKTKTGHSTDNEVLTALKDSHPVVADILHYRTMTKLKSGFLDVITGFLDKQDRIFPSYNQNVTATGRLSASNPNIQNIPIRGEEGREIRKIFIPLFAGDVIIKADYSQIELRILAHFSQDKRLIEVFNGEGDVHALTAASIFGVGEKEVTKDQRRAAKTINFGIVYGMSPYGLAKELEISNPEAAEYINRFFATFPGVKQYQDETVDAARKKGYAETLFGRRRFLNDIKSANRTVREFAERAAINAPIQGTAADIIKIAMINVEKEINARRLGAKMILQVHDELVLSAPKKEAAEVKELLTKAMEGAAKLDVPMTITVGEGSNWYECG